MTTIHVGDCLDVLAGMPAESVHCVVTSPPYWGLRSYQGDPGMIGLEPTFDAHLERLVAVFREVRRVLRDDGICWLNYGDAYAGSWGAQSRPENSSPARADGLSGRQIEAHPRGTNTGSMSRTPGLKPKDLMMMPARVALALQADGWWVRSKVIWHKKNPMPESCTDRPTSSYEEMFLLTKSGAPTFWTHRGRPGVRSQPDPDHVWRNRDTSEETAVEPSGWRDLLSKRDSKQKLWRRVNLWDGHDYHYDADAVRVPYNAGSLSRYETPMQQLKAQNRQPGREGLRDNCDQQPNPAGANLRNVWTISTHSFPDAHFATFPPALVEPCILAGTSARGVCAACGAPWVRETNTTHENPGNRTTNGPRSVENRAQTAGFEGRLEKRVETTGWAPSCACGAATVPATVLDPFCGSGTVGLVAERLQRDAILIDISATYAQMAEKRIREDAPLLTDVRVDVDKPAI